MKRLALLFNARYSPAAWNIIIPLLAVVIALLIVVLIYLYLEKIKALFAKKEDSESTKVVEVVKVATTTEKVFVAAPVTKVGQSASIGDGRIIYNYSFQARRHLMDEKGLALYNTLKNHIMAYDHVSVNQTWEHEIFMTSGRAFARMRFHGKTFKLYLDLDASDYPEPKFPLLDQKGRKIDETTPTLLNIKGPRMMQYGCFLIDEILAGRGVSKTAEPATVNYKVAPLDFDTLLEMGLIVIVGGKFKKAKAAPAPAPTPAAPALDRDKPVIYNYSFQARRHLMDESTLALYNTLKNYLLRYSEVSSNQTWDHEIFTSSGRALVKLRFHGKTFKVYLDVAARDYPEPKYALSDESKKKAHATTPTLLNVRGPRMMQYALSLISDIAQARGLTLNEAYEDADFKVDAKTRKQLFDEGLIKSSDGTFTLVD